MTMRHFPLHSIIVTSMLAAAGCGAFAAGADQSQPRREAGWGLDAATAAGARLLPGGTEFQAESTALWSIGIAPKWDAPFIVPAERVDTADLAPGALLDVWLND